MPRHSFRLLLFTLAMALSSLPAEEAADDDGVESQSGTSVDLSKSATKPVVVLPTDRTARFEILLMSTRGEETAVAIDPAFIEQVRAACGVSGAKTQSAVTTELKTKQQITAQIGAYAVSITVREIGNTTRVSLTVRFGDRLLVDKQIIGFGESIPVVQVFNHESDGSTDVIAIRQTRR
ncbi:MAG: hypothetical protein ABIH86_01635 [Planctomycetota bacterium]